MATQNLSAQSVNSKEELETLFQENYSQLRECEALAYLMCEYAYTEKGNIQDEAFLYGLDMLLRQLKNITSENMDPMVLISIVEKLHAKND